MNSYPTKDMKLQAEASPVENPGARICSVELGSPADDAGFEPGCVLLTVDGEPLRDLLDWQWLSAADEITVGYIDLDGDQGEVELAREEGEHWGFEFEGVVFDGIKQCRNNCMFCFMQQLPKGLRPSLTLRDDDFRLSFLSGTFVTLTNVKPEEERRIVNQRISPLHVSLHAVNSEVRRRMIGAHAAHGLEVLERLLHQGIQAYVQIVLVPGVNDGEVLRETLTWAYEHPGILSVGIVPLGYTKYQEVFSRSFNNPHESKEVLRTVNPFRKRAEAERGTSWVYPADEFYRNAYGEALLGFLPEADTYGAFDMFEDGIGIVRSNVDSWMRASTSGVMYETAEALRTKGLTCKYVCGYAMEPLFHQLIEQSCLVDTFEDFPIQNNFFGGNVDVTGLLCGCDIVAALNDWQTQHQGLSEDTLWCLPAVLFNDDGLTLDGFSLEDMEKATGLSLAVVSCTPEDYLAEIARLAHEK